MLLKTIKIKKTSWTLQNLAKIKMNVEDKVEEVSEVSESNKDVNYK